MQRLFTGLHAGSRYTGFMVDGRRAPGYDVAAALSALAAADPKLAVLMERAGPYTLRLKSQHSPFEALLEAILSQQLHGAAARAILHKLLKLFGDIHPTPELLLAQPDEALRAAGLSRNKMLALQDLARKTQDGTVPALAAIRRMPDDEIVERLCEVRGVGRWTVEMLLMFRLGRPDVLPLSDYGVRKGFALTFSRLSARALRARSFDAALLGDPKVMALRGERWRPWRSVASWYMWRACDLHGKPMDIPPAA